MEIPASFLLLPVFFIPMLLLFILLLLLSLITEFVWVCRMIVFQLLSDIFLSSSRWTKSFGSFITILIGGLRSLKLSQSIPLKKRWFLISFILLDPNLVLGFRSSNFLVKSSISSVQFSLSTSGYYTSPDSMSLNNCSTVSP